MEYFFFSAFLSCNSQIKLIYLKCTMWWFDICTYCERIPTMEFTHPSAHLFVLCIWEHVCPTLLANFSDTVLWMYHVVLRSSDLIYLLTESLCHSHFPHPSAMTVLFVFYLFHEAKCLPGSSILLLHIARLLFKAEKYSIGGVCMCIYFGQLGCFLV